MRLIYSAIDKATNAGSVELEATQDSDMWHLYNLIAVGDELTTTSLRKVVKESSSGTTSSTKLIVRLTLGVESVDFDEQMGQLRIRGKNRRENDHVKLGAYHTVEVEIGRPFTLIKTYWDAIHLQRIRMACDADSQATLAAIVFQPGLANICLVTQYQTLVKLRLEMSIPKKRRPDQHQEGMNRFYNAIIDAIRTKLQLNQLKCIVIASPAHYKDDLLSYIYSEAVRQQYRDLIDNKAKFITAYASTGFVHSLNEALKDEKVLSRISDTKALDEVKALQDFYSMLNNSPDRAQYGYEHCKIANEQKAIESLLVSDSLFRAADLGTRHRYVGLVESVKENSGVVYLFSSAHQSGQALDQLSGIAAILRFPLHDELYEKTDSELAETTTTITLPSSSSSSASSSSSSSVPLNRNAQIQSGLIDGTGRSGDSEGASTDPLYGPIKPKLLQFGGKYLIKAPISIWEDDSDEEDYYYVEKKKKKQQMQQQQKTSLAPPISPLRSSISMPELSRNKSNGNNSLPPNTALPNDISPSSSIKHLPGDVTPPRTVTLASSINKNNITNTPSTPTIPTTANNNNSSSSSSSSKAAPVISIGSSSKPASASKSSTLGGKNATIAGSSSSSSSSSSSGKKPASTTAASTKGGQQQQSGKKKGGGGGKKQRDLYEDMGDYDDEYDHYDY